MLRQRVLRQPGDGLLDHAVAGFAGLVEADTTSDALLIRLGETAAGLDVDAVTVLAQGTDDSLRRVWTGPVAPEPGARPEAVLLLNAGGRTWGRLELYRSHGPLGAEVLATAGTLSAVVSSYLLLVNERDAARHAQSALADRAMNDPLTGLPVRWVLLERLGHALARLERHPGHLGVLFVDLDDLKYVNDSYGHPAGDRLITTCVRRIRSALRPTDLLARVGGDEFVVVLEDIAGPEAASRVAERVLDQLAAPFRPDGEVLQPSASIGIAVTRRTSLQAADSVDTLIAHADAAMYRAKHLGRGRYELFDPVVYAADRQGAAERNALAAALQSALRDGALRLHYQPILHLSHPSAGEGPTVHAVEALLRWQHPDRGLLPAAEFVTAAERSGLMREVSAWVLGTACMQLAAWDRELGALAPERVFINLSPSELEQAGLARLVADRAQAAGIAPDRLTMEIPELTLCPAAPAAAAAVRELQALGCRLAIGEFGDGRCSLGGLVDTPAETLKVARSFTRRLTVSQDARTVVSAALLLGRALHRNVVVEGVEDPATLDLLRQLGCEQAQGFHLALPQTARDLTARLLGSAGRR